MSTSFVPPMVTISIGHPRYTHKLITETGEFVLAFPSKEIEAIIDHIGSCSGRNTNKFLEFDIETIEAKNVKPSLIKDAVACFECKITEKLVTEDHTIFSGEIIASYTSEKHTPKDSTTLRKNFSQ